MKLLMRRLLLLLMLVGLAVAISLGTHFLRSKSASTLERGVDRNDLHLIPIGKAYQEGRIDFRDAAVLENGEIWVAGYDGQDPRRMFHSTDKGRNWEVKPIPSSGFTLTTISFSDSTHGCAVGGYGLIMCTNDAGRTWSQINRPTEAALDEVVFATAKVGYAAGRTGTRDPNTGDETFGVEILRTEDGGVSWRTVYQDKESDQVWSLAAFSDSVALAVINGERLIRTMDGGKTWQKLTSDIVQINCITFTSGGALWIAGNNLLLRYSLDQGTTWIKPDHLPPVAAVGDWISIQFNRDGKGLVVGKFGAAMATFDEGKTWLEVKSGTRETLGVARLGDDTALVIGQQKVYTLDLK